MLRPRLLVAALLAAALAYSLRGVWQRVVRMLTPGSVCTDADASPVRVGLLGAAKIAPFGLLHPASRLPCAVRVVAVGARDAARAAALAKQWGIQKHGTYSTVLGLEEVEAVYLPLLNGLHYEWAAAALRAGKHVLVEKPIASNAAEARSLARLAKSRSLVLAEAYHWRFHPIASRLKEVVRSGELGQPTSLEVTAGLPSPDALFSAGRSALRLQRPEGPPPAKMDVSLGGGNFMGQGCYTVSVARYLFGEPLRLLNASAVEDVDGSRADLGTSATLLFPKGVTAVLRSSALSIGFNVHLTASRGSLSLTNYLFPHIYHALSVHPDSAPARTERVYGDGAPTFELQLAAFAAAVRGRSRFPITPADSVENMRWIDAIYDATGLGKRPSRDRYVTALFV